MGCNCGGGQATTWSYVAPNGVAVTYKTEVEARAAMIRAGNVGEVKNT